MRCNDLRERVVKYLETADLDEIGPMTVAGLADRFGVTRFHLSRCFRRHLQESIHHHLQNTKMHKLAEWIMQHPAHSLEEISERVGFYSSRYFMKVFQHTVGHSPLSATQPEPHSVFSKPCTSENKK